MKEINTDLLVKQINNALVEADKKLEILEKELIKAYELGYDKGYAEGWSEGWDDSWESAKEIFKKNKTKKEI